MKNPINRDLKTTLTTFLLILILCCCYRKWRLHKKPELSGVSAGDTPPPGVSILKPLCASGDPNLFTNLETFFTLEYPKVNFIFNTSLQFQVDLLKIICTRYYILSFKDCLSLCLLVLTFQQSRPLHFSCQKTQQIIHIPSKKIIEVTRIKELIQVNRK